MNINSLIVSIITGLTASAFGWWMNSVSAALFMLGLLLFVRLIIAETTEARK